MTKPTLKVLGPALPGAEAVLTPDALAFAGGIVAAFAPKIDALLEARAKRAQTSPDGSHLDFLAETADVRSGDWKAAPLPKDLLDRRVEITGPVDRKMVINALNSGANVFMADFEDATSPTWSNVVLGQVNLRDAVRRAISFDDERTGKHYELGDAPATLMVRPRGLHLRERHVRLVKDGAEVGTDVPGALFDFSLYFFHNAKELVARGTGPYFYLPKLESHKEAALWNEVFVHAQKELGIPVGTIKATVLIETLPAAFEMDEIIHALRDHSAGLNCGRWDYIFSFIKRTGRVKERVLPDRADVGMAQPFMRAYTQLLIKTCHRRGVCAMGGMAAQIPIKSDPAANEAAIAKVRADKEREATDGHDGTWVAHPGLVAVARGIFDAKIDGTNQLSVMREDVSVSREDLLALPTGNRTEAGLRQNVRVGVQYIEAWLRGQGCVPLYNLMEDAATAEISRSQVWQWLQFAAELEAADGTRRTLDEAWFRAVLDDEMAQLKAALGPERFESGRFDEATELFAASSTAKQLDEFLTLGAYAMLPDGA